MVVETPGGRVTRRPRGVSDERERGARARPGPRPVVRARAREPVVTYRARDPGPTPSALTRGAGRGPVSALEGRREVETRTDRHAPTGVVAVAVVVPVARRFFKDFRPGSRPSGERRSALVLDATTSFFCAVAPVNGAAVRACSDARPG